MPFENRPVLQGLGVSESAVAVAALPLVLLLIVDGRSEIFNVPLAIFEAFVVSVVADGTSPVTWLAKI
jgi:hypothetical protein